MATANTGDQVVVTFRVFTLDGRLIGGTQGDKKETLTLGQGQVFKAVEDGIVGMVAGEQKVIAVPAEQAFGPRREELVLPVPRESIPAGVEPQLGVQLPITLEGDVQLTFTVTKITDTTLVLDANHPLAGQELYFSVTLVEVKAAVDAP